jgi:Ser/Thr protein kinase RdoA (MazF antagonist)
VQAAAGQCVKAGRWLRFYHDVEGRAPDRPLEPGRKWPLLLDAFSELARHGFDRGRLDHVTERLRAVAEDACAEARPVASLHGDFTVKNVLIEDDATIGIDLWGAHENVVDHDIASFLNSLTLLKLTRPAPTRALDRLRDAFLEGYHGARRSPGSATVLLQAIGLADGALEILKRRPTPAARVWVVRTVGAAIDGLVDTRYRAEGSGAPVA